MGNKQCQVKLVLDDTNYTAGTLLTGRVCLSIHNEEQADAVHLRLVGEECSTIAHDESDHDQRAHASRHHPGHHREIERSTSSLVHMDVPLTQFPSSVVAPGQYEFPFEWELPSHLPSSMYCAKSDSHCEIRYRLTAYLHKNGAYGDPKHSDEKAICISAQPDPDLVNTTGIAFEPETFPIKTCCFDQGKVALGWDTSTTAASPGSVVDIGISGGNASQVEVSYLRARWNETVSWSALGRTEELTRTLCESKISTSNLPRWHPNTHSTNINFQLINPFSYNQIGANGQDHPRVATQLHLPADSRDTYKGSLVQVRHTLIVTAVTPGGCCITSPESAALVQVHREATGMPAEAVVDSTPTLSAEPTFVAADLIPEDWQPQESHVVTLPMSSAILLDSNYSPPSASAPDESLLQESHNIATNLSQLEASLSSSDDPVNTLSDHLNNPKMVATIQNLTPREFVQVVQSSPRNWPKVARMLAGAMDEHFQCRYVLACLWALPQEVRLDVMREVAPLASDLETQRSMIERELDANELVNFRAALT